jgi:hypothetical protein
MKKLILAIFIFPAFISAYAQNSGSVKGKLVDTAARQVLPDATISVLTVKDSALVTFTMSDINGLFEIKNLEPAGYVLMISYSGYEDYKKGFSIANQKKNVDLGEVILQKAIKTLAGVEVVSVAPVKVSGDTVAFKADAFKTKPNATAEDLLKKLPGVQVQKDGTVSAMGENVQKVLVDGKEFFGSDPKLATKNITADMIDQVQVFDDMSEQAKFTKIDDGSRSKTINIKLKKDKNKGDFGKVMAGVGSDSRYEASMMYNRFRGNQRFSVLAGSNNVNKQNFSFSDIISSMGGMSQFSRGGTGGGGGFGGGGMSPMMMGMGGFGSSGNGITTSTTAGLNYNDQFNSKIDFRSSYFFTHTSNELLQSSYRKSFFPDDSSTSTYTDSRSKNINNNHRLNIRGEYAIDSMNSLLYTLNMNIQQSDGKYTDTSSTFSDAMLHYLAITGNTYYINERKGMNYSGELLYRRKFRRPGRTFTFGWRNGYNESEADGKNISDYITHLPDGSPGSGRPQNFNNLQDTRANSNTLSTSYTEPVGNNKLVEVNYAYTNNINVSDKDTYNYNGNTGKYDVPNIVQTNYFENTNVSHRIGANYRVQEKKYNYQVGMGVQFTELGSTSLRGISVVDTTIKQNFVNLFPTASFNYSVNRTKNLRINYRGRTNAPSVNQLQDVPDVTNPAQIKTGNPALKQEFIQNLNVFFSNFDIKTFRFITANIGIGTTSNKIVNSTDSINKVVIITKPVNMQGTYNTNAFFSVGFPVKKFKGSNLNFSTILNYNHDVNEVYKEKNVTGRLLLSQLFGINYNYKEKLDFGINGNLSYNNTRYSLQQDLNESYFTQTYSADISYTFKKEFILYTDLDYVINSGRSEGYNLNIPMLNAALGKQFLKNKAAELKISVFDMLKQNKSINRTTVDNYYEDTRSNVITRYFLISFTYNLNRMANRNQQQMPQNMQRMMERGMRQFRH